jgi:hypothetical protein
VTPIKGRRGFPPNPKALRNSGWRPPLIHERFMAIKEIAKARNLTIREAVEQALDLWMKQNG